MKQLAKKVFNLMDLTSLNDSDDQTIVNELCRISHNEFGSVAAICIFSEFIPSAAATLKSISLNPAIKIATVVNFPYGHSDVELISYETKLALSRGADEIDLVLPYHQLKKGNTQTCIEMVRQIKSICGNKTLKVILETGELSNQQIKLASEISINNGANFIKTSTGKISINATLEAAEVMLNVIKQSGKQCGFKASGGIKTVEQAVKYIDLATNIFDNSWVTPHNFRFGASGLLNDVMSILRFDGDQSNKVNQNATEY